MKILSKSDLKYDESKHYLWFRENDTGVVKCAEVPKIIETIYDSADIHDISIDAIEITEQYLIEFQKFINELEPQPLEVIGGNVSRLNSCLIEMFWDLIPVLLPRETRLHKFVEYYAYDVNNYMGKLRTSYVID